ncbi:hypothetical protein XENTR_v10019664 [Xenopus tropicalis]|nr:hypothetical protein XENTR_v10019664 [Xenopus tropicalis]
MWILLSLVFMASTHEIIRQFADRHPLVTGLNNRVHIVSTEVFTPVRVPSYFPVVNPHYIDADSALVVQNIQNIQKIRLLPLPSAQQIQTEAVTVPEPYVSKNRSRFI